MKTIDNKQVEKLLEDIASIKEVINKNKPILQQVADLTHFRLLSLLSAISVAIFSILFYFLLNIYGSHNAIPGKYKWIIYIVMAVIYLALAIMKQRLYLSSVKKLDKNLTLRWLYKELFSSGFAHLYFSSIFLIVLLVVFYITNDIAYFIIPSLSIFIGLLSISGAMLHLKHALVMGYWFFITGIFFIIFNTIPASIAVLITFGLGFLLMSVLGYMEKDSGKVE